MYCDMCCSQLCSAPSYVLRPPLYVDLLLRIHQFCPHRHTYDALPSAGGQPRTLVVAVKGRCLLPHPDRCTAPAMTWTSRMGRSPAQPCLRLRPSHRRRRPSRALGIITPPRRALRRYRKEAGALAGISTAARRFAVRLSVRPRRRRQPGGACEPPRWRRNKWTLRRTRTQSATQCRCV